MAASSDPDTATAQTIGIMCGHVRNAVSDGLVQFTAAEARQRFGNITAGDMHGASEALRIARAAWWWPKLWVKFVHHDFIIKERLGESGHLQGLIAPEVLVRMDRPQGDCAIFSECVAAFLTCLGLGYEFVTVAANPREPEIFSHVYVYAVMPDGSRLPLDASHGDYPGWQVPSAHVTRRQVWDSAGNPVADRGSRFDGLHNYGLRGLGDIESDYAAFMNAGGFDQYDPPNPYDYVSVDSGTPYSGPVYTAPSQNSAQWAGFSTALAKMGFDLARINAIKEGTVISADGSMLRQNPGYSVPSGPGASLSIKGGGTNVLLMAGLGLGALLVVGSMMKGGR